MPKKILTSNQTPTFVAERLRIWGSAIKVQRISQNVAASDLCTRMGVSIATLRRLEKGDPGAGAGIYLSALLILGLMDEAAPMLANALWTPGLRSRSKRKSRIDDEEYF